MRGWCDTMCCESYWLKSQSAIVPSRTALSWSSVPGSGVTMKNEARSTPTSSSHSADWRPLSAVEGKADHVAAVHRHALAVPVAAHAAVLLLDRLERGRHVRPVLALAVLLLEVLHLGHGEQVLRIEGLEADEGRVAAGLGRKAEEALALLALAGRLLAGLQV